MKQATSPLLWAAVDVSARDHVVAITTDWGAPLRLQNYPSTPAGHRQWSQQLTTEALSIRVAMEATGVWRDPRLAAPSALGCAVQELLGQKEKRKGKVEGEKRA
jgi:hypothetical protein